MISRISSEVRPSERMQCVQPPIIPIVSELSRTVPGTISMGQGVAYYGPPPHVFERVKRFLSDRENHKYGSVQGLSPLTELTRAIVTISPNNPSGAVYPEALLREINSLCRLHGIYHISDEAYENFTYGAARHFSPAAIEGAETHTIALYSLSKAYGFASWRIGYMLIPEHLYDSVLKAQDTNLICAPLISQYAALGALEVGSSYCRERLPAIERVRAVVLDELATLDSR